MKLLGIISVDSNVINQLLIIYSIFLIQWRKKWGYNGTVHHLLTGVEKVYDLVRREVLYNTLIEFGITMTLVWLIKTFSDEMYSKVC
jgi:hypothetical protein